jgi:EAL domain-containing protein (putative c-di-GMP-specific phosphodiesterase class I)
VPGNGDQRAACSFGTGRSYGHTRLKKRSNPKVFAVVVTGGDTEVMTRRRVESEFDQILSRRLMRTEFQPIVDLASEQPIGYEALVRGPVDSPLESASALIDVAYATGRVVEFDWVARASACRTALDLGLGPDRLLFLNIEPLALDSDCPPDLWPDIERAFATYQVVLEVTERSLDREPGSLLDGVAAKRSLVAGFALDDVGVNPASLSVMPLVAPSVIKLDHSIIHDGPTQRLSGVLDIAFEECERTGASILAEGIETAEDADLARSLRADLGQGWYFGRPAALDEHGADARRPSTVRARTAPPAEDPFDALRGLRTAHADESLVEHLIRQIRPCSSSEAVPALFICLLPDAAHVTDEWRDRLTELAGSGATAVVLAPDLAFVLDGVRGPAPHAELPWPGWWAGLTLGPGAASALIARPDPGAPGRYEYGVTHDRQRVIAAARILFRLVGSPS